MSDENEPTMQREYEIHPSHGERNLLGTAREVLRTQVRIFRGERLGQIGLAIFFGFLLIGLFAPVIAPYEPDAINRGPDGGVLRLEPPSAEHPFGTTRFGRDVFSQTIVATRVSLLVGFLGAFMAVAIGTTIGIVSAYYGGWTDDVLMRITDIVYGIPFLPFIIVLVLILGEGLFNIVVAISLIMWRPTARVIRSQVLSVKERPFVEAADAVGAGDFRIMFRHIFPNVLPLTLLYGALSVAWAISTEASVAFVGFGDPEQVSWGKMIFRAYTSSAIRDAWWWVVFPGLSLSLLVISVFFISRAYEKVANPDLENVEG